jgi:hypothetical protein
MTLRRLTRDAIALPLAMQDFLLHIDRPEKEIDELRASGIEYDSFGRFDWDFWPDEKIDELWQVHGSQLRAEARRRGIALPPGRR